MIIKNIIFDFGGVIIDINYQATRLALQQLGAPDFTAGFSRKSEYAFFNEYEIGKLTSEQFRAKLRACLKQNVTDEELDKAWNALLLDIPPERFALLRDLKQQYRTFLFSNTNAIHLAAVQEICQRDHQVHSLDEFFEKQYFSHLMGVRKPDAEGFLTILTENNLNPAETLFVDDLSENILGAQKVGLQTLHLTTPYTLLDIPKLIHGKK